MRCGCGVDACKIAIMRVVRCRCSDGIGAAYGKQCGDKFYL